MSNIESVLNFITKNPSQYYCDDCLSEVLSITPRQQINQICRKLEKGNTLIREVDQCSNCSKDKILNKVR
ncbi:hypothetical protein NSS71_08475 [Niallia sp. FSL W8-0951]|uniref:hypothetical protein n=1 Tax=Niallia sp. FSL W8-0951 TaxID=2954639 RepID=UPI0030FAFB45